MASADARADAGDDPWEYCLRKYLLILATMVGTITYTAGFNPPGGVWQDTDAAAGHLAGDPIIRDTSYHRYLAFYYINAAAFTSSLVVIMLILILAVLHEKKKKKNASSSLWLPVNILRIVMVLDLLSLMAAYAAGTWQYGRMNVYSSLMMAITFVHFTIQLLLAATTGVSDDQIDQIKRQKECKDLQRQRKMLMLLATFAASVTYLAGLSAPGGFWDSAEDGHRPGVAILMGRHERRLQAFFLFNTMAFAASLIIISRLLDQNLLLTKEVEIKRNTLSLYAFVLLMLLGLIGSYATGSCRKISTSFKASSLVAVAVLVFIVVLVRIIKYIREGSAEQQQQQSHTPHEEEGQLEKARSLVMLLATLAATITYQAGLDPPGGLWEEDGEGYLAGDPILLTMNPRRYKAFFYCNSVAFVASLLAIILVKLRVLLRYHALEAAMILDLFGLIGAYATGSCRDVSSTIYAMALAGAVLVYVVIHVVFFTLDLKGQQEADEYSLEKRRKRLLLFSILAATITYQAGLTPPSGFRLQDDVKPGHHAGDPVLLYNYPRRYRTFFYCNSVSFMLSIAQIILLVNPNLYRPAIRSNALSVCTAAGMLSLVSAYAVGSTQHLKTSLYIFSLVAAVLIAVLVALVLFAHPVACWNSKTDNHEINTTTTPPPQITEAEHKQKLKEKELHAKRKYVMLLGILVASVTYQAGLKPPGGMWQSDGVGHAAGNPIMHDNRWLRYQVFFYTNSVSFVASVIVILILLLASLVEENVSIRAMNTTIALDLLGLLLAYAVGSSRSRKTSGKVLALVAAVLVYVGIHAFLSFCIGRHKKNADPNQLTSKSSCHCHCHRHVGPGSHVGDPKNPDESCIERGTNADDKVNNGNQLQHV